MKKKYFVISAKQLRATIPQDQFESVARVAGKCWLNGNEAPSTGHDSKPKAGRGRPRSATLTVPILSVVNEAIDAGRPFHYSEAVRAVSNRCPDWNPSDKRPAVWMAINASPNFRKIGRGVFKKV